MVDSESKSSTTSKSGITISLDGGCDKYFIGASIYDEDKPAANDNLRGGVKAISAKAYILIAIVDKIAETYDNLVGERMMVCANY